MSEVRLQNISKSFGQFQAVKDVNLTFPERTTTCLLGPSGCGKTTLMRIIVGLESPTTGEVLIGGKVVNGQPPRRRDIAMVFQYPTIYRGLSVYQNIELPLREQKIDPATRKQRVEEAIALLGLEKNLDDNPERFDNSVRQRVAFARAVARRSSILLFDEPITNVDPQSRLQLKEDLKKLTQRLKQTIIYVTHDQNEAMTLADQIVLLRDGVVLQQAAPRQLYDHPAHVFGGWFLGSPGMNFLEHAPSADGSGHIHSDLFPFPVMLRGSGRNDKLTFGVRPEQLEVLQSPAPDAVPAMVRRRFRGVGGQFILFVQLDEQVIKAKVNPALGKVLGDQVWIRCRPESVTVFDGSGQTIDAAVVPATNSAAA
jgi:ABC-type sugar transport system ATPase subunit